MTRSKRKRPGRYVADCKEQKAQRSSPGTAGGNKKGETDGSLEGASWSQEVLNCVDCVIKQNMAASRIESGIKLEMTMKERERGSTKQKENRWAMNQ